MRAAVYEKLGPPDVLHVIELPEPHPAKGEVRVRVGVSGVNPTDWKTRSAGPGKEMPYEYVVPNHDGAGVIDEVGEGVDSSRMGQRVWMYLAQRGRQHGTAAQWVCLPQRHAVPLPDAATFELGASLGVPALTASHALLCDGPIGGTTVLISGGAGAVGNFAIQLARRAGARVITTVSTDAKAELAMDAGADVVVNYREANAAEEIRHAAPDGVDRVVEVGPSNLELDAEVLARGGVILMYASTEVDPVLPVRRFMNLSASIRFMLLHLMSRDDLDAAVAGVSAALADGALRAVLPFERFTLDEIGAAHAAVEGGTTGKVLVEIE